VGGNRTFGYVKIPATNGQSAGLQLHPTEAQAAREMVSRVLTVSRCDPSPCG
jgi:hypothetical protein